MVKCTHQLQSHQSGFEPWSRTLCCALGLKADFTLTVPSIETDG